MCRRGGTQAIVLDYRDRRPLYEQVTERFQELMLRGVLTEEMQLPSVRSLAAELSINPNTIQRAYAELERQGYIYSIKGKGSFVANWSRVRSGLVREWERQFDELAAEGERLGITRRQMAERLGAGKEQPEAGGGKEGQDGSAAEDFPERKGGVSND